MSPSSRQLYSEDQAVGPSTEAKTQVKSCRETIFLREWMRQKVQNKYKSRLEHHRNVVVGPIKSS